MIDNTTELLSVIAKGMSEEGVELTNVELNEQAIELNKKVKVCIGSKGKGNEVWFLVRKVDTKYCIQSQLYSIDSMLDKVLELLKEKGDGESLNENKSIKLWNKVASNKKIDTQPSKNILVRHSISWYD